LLAKGELLGEPLPIQEIKVEVPRLFIRLVVLEERELRPSEGPSIFQFPGRQHRAELGQVPGRITGYSKYPISGSDTYYFRIQLH
jgi:hypothetical protein